MLWLLSLYFTSFLLSGSHGIKYALEIHTADKTFAGTGEDIHINIHGSKGEGGWQKYESWLNGFEENDYDHVDYFGKDVGDVTSIVVKLTEEGWYLDNWNLDYVKVSVHGNEYIGYFRYIFNKDGETHTPRSFRINKCRHGFEQVTINRIPYCKDRNECLTACKADGQICTNTNGGYLCKCKRGFLPFGDKCVDIDECADSSRNPCPYANAVCTNKPGGYKCECKKGYAGEATSCVDYDECKYWNDNKCSQTCANTVGGYHCSCRKGYNLGPDEKECLNNDECKKPDLCDRTTSVCYDEVGSFRCLCKKGFVNHPTIKNKCVRRECSMLSKSIIGDQNIIISPAECSMKGKRHFGDACHFSCNPGYELAPMSAAKYNCDHEGHWTGAGNIPRCSPKMCPVIKPPTNGYVIPGSCGSTGMQQGGSCYFYCNNGFKLNGPQSFHCSLQKYDKDSKTAMCVRTPRMVCPNDIRLNLPSNKNTVAIGDSYPSYTTNMREDQIVSHPRGVGPTYEFPFGSTSVIYRATNEIGETERCTFMVNVKDVHPPVVEFCPEDLYLTSRGESVLVKWKEPRFTDNVGIENIRSSQKNNMTHQPTTFLVVYDAVDKSALHSKCQFRVHIKVLVCDFKTVVGADQVIQQSCMPFYGGRAFCRAHCAPGKTFHFIKTNTGLKNMWNCYRGDFGIGGRLPDCVDFTPNTDDSDCPVRFIKSLDYRSYGRVNVCAKCPRGTFYQNGLCNDCPISTYQDQEGSLQCKSCPIGTKTREPRNVKNNCQPLCVPGSYSSSGFNDILKGGCKRCPVNTFSDRIGTTICTKCPNGTATEGSGSKSELSCLYGPRNVTLDPEGSTTVSYGGNIHFDCFAEGLPTPFLTFRRLKPMSGNDASRHSLVPVPLPNHKPGQRALRYLIKAATFYDSDIYICIAENRRGEIRKSITLKVISGEGSGDGANLV